MWHYEYMELFNQQGKVRENIHTYNYIKKRQRSGGPLSSDEARYLVEMEKRIRDNPEYYNQFLEVPFNENNNQSMYFADQSYEEEDYYNDDYYDEDDDYCDDDRYEQVDDDEDKDDILDDLLWLAILEEDGSL